MVGSGSQADMRPGQTWPLRSALGLGLLCMCWALPACMRGSDEPQLPRLQDVEPSQPFGQHRHEYSDGSIVPTLHSTAKLDQATIEFYEQWRSRYLREGCESGQYYVATGSDPAELTSSEVTGYAMIITSLMAGHDARARAYFDGMLRFFRAHQSALTKGLMAAHQDERCRDVEGDKSETNGDLDIAYALLLADRQWGSCRGVDYAEHARWMIGALADAALHREGRYMLLGDWVAPSDERYYNATRTSDFMPSQLRAFGRFMGQDWWIGVIDNGYWLLETLQVRHSPLAGLLPDIVEAADSDTPHPASSGFVAGSGEGSYSYGALRVPLRIGADFVTSGDRRAKRILDPINAFMRSQSGDDPSRVAAGYALGGEPLAERETMAMTAPLGVSAMVDEGNQEWLNRIWRRIAEYPPEDAYADSVRLLSMLLLSGNWWVPNQVSDSCAAEQPANR